MRTRALISNRALRRSIQESIDDGNGTEGLSGEDKETVVDGVARAEEHGPAWCEARKELIFAAVLTYSDEAGGKILEALREAFWTTEFDP